MAGKAKKDTSTAPLIAVSYARVSTKKEEQLESLKKQKEHFAKYTEDHNMILKKIYTDEGISGTKTRNRKEFLRMIHDAQMGLYQVLLVKDVSRLARNTLDFLENLRKLQNSGIKIIYLSYGGEAFEGEMILTFMAALAQEESRNMSGRIKFGKKLSKEKGVVPTQVYGYDKVENDAYSLTINKEEAKIVKEIYDMYLSENMGASKIAIALNERGLRTKRDKYWSNNAIVRILKNEIYTGRIINGKQEVVDFLSSKREEKESDEWYVRDYPEIRLISDEQFENAQNLLQGRAEEFKFFHKSQRSKYLFSTLIKCQKCGRSFRCIQKVKSTYYICYNRNERTSNMCGNMTQIYEEDLKNYIMNYFKDFVAKKESIIGRCATEIKKVYDADTEVQTELDEVDEKLAELKDLRDKETELYKAGIISIEEVTENTKDIVAEIKKLESYKKTYTYSNYDTTDFARVLRKSFKTIEDFVEQGEFTNEGLKKVISSIDAYEDGKVVIHVKPFEDIGLTDIVRFVVNRT